MTFSHNLDPCRTGNRGTGRQNTELAGLRDTGRDYGWDIDRIIGAAAGPGGKVTWDAFEALTAPLLCAANSARVAL